jgi:catechol 2,3-dioxygenase-like lactoylglutathione lyase family enzyme
MLPGVVRIGQYRCVEWHLDWQDVRPGRAWPRDRLPIVGSGAVECESAHVRRESGRVHKPVIVGEQGPAEFGSEPDVDGIGHRQVVTKSPRCGDQRSGLRSAQVPSIEPAQHCRGALLGQRPSHDSLMSHDPGDFDVEVLGHPAHGIGRKQSCDTPTAGGVGEDLDASGRVDDNGRHACSDSARIVSSTAAASRDSISGSGAVRSSSMSKRNAAGEQSSSGFATTTRSCNSSARRHADHTRTSVRVGLRTAAHDAFSDSAQSVAPQLHGLRPRLDATAAHADGRVQRFCVTKCCASIARATPQTGPTMSVGAVHHIDLWVPSLDRAIQSYGWVLEALGYAEFQRWDSGRSWQRGGTYVAVEESTALVGREHDRLRPGVNHLAFHAGSVEHLDRLVEEAPRHGWQLMFEDRHPHAADRTTTPRSSRIKMASRSNWLQIQNRLFRP